jgi:SAM-dependent methyltransferase
VTAAEGEWFVDAFDRHYPVLYQHRDAAEARRCLDLLPRLAPLGGGPVLDLGCGTGRHLAILAARGVAAVGLDLSAALLRTAARRRVAEGVAYGLVRADMRAGPLRSGVATAVLSLFTAFGYFGRAAEDAAVVAEVARMLASGGHWFLDYLAADRVRAELTAGRTAPREREVGPLRIREEKRLATGPDRVVKTVALWPRADHEQEARALGVPPGGRRYTERVRLFTLPELDRLAVTAGLVRVAAAGGYRGQKFGADDADRWILVYAKRGGHGRRRPESGGTNG